MRSRNPRPPTRVGRGCRVRRTHTHTHTHFHFHRTSKRRIVTTRRFRRGVRWTATRDTAGTMLWRRCAAFSRWSEKARWHGIRGPSLYRRRAQAKALRAKSSHESLSLTCPLKKVLSLMIPWGVHTSGRLGSDMGSSSTQWRAAAGSGSLYMDRGGGGVCGPLFFSRRPG